MKSNNLEISSSNNLNSTFKSIEDVKEKEKEKGKEKENESKKRELEEQYKLLYFFILTAFVIILFFVIILLLIYKYIIRPDLEKSKENKKSQKYQMLHEKKKIRKFVEKCMDGILLDDKKYPKVEYPKISVIIRVYDEGQFILKNLRSIQNQSFKDIEIIFYDNISNDNSTKLIEKYQKEDERIILLKQENNKGTLCNIIDVANIAKGEYILFIDADDIFVDKHILKQIYSKAYKANIDIIQFQAYSGDYDRTLYLSNNNRSIEPIYQPQLSNLMYYEKGHLEQTEFFIKGKLIKRGIFLEVINSIDKYYLNQHMTLFEDSLILFILFKKANSYLFIRDYGMLFYDNENDQRIENAMINKETINKIIKDCFLYLEYMFQHTNNTLYEKDIAVNQLKYLMKKYNDIYKNITTDFEYIYKVVDLFLYCDIIIEEDKKIIKELKDQFKLIESNLVC